MDTKQNISTPEQPFVSECPMGCATGLADSTIVLPEGPLRSCLSCGHLVSSCSEKRYWATMQEFDAPEGTWPSERGLNRMVKRAGRMMTECETVLDKPRNAIRLLDVGCSSGALVYAFQTIGVQAEGVEPSSSPAQTAIAHGLKVHQGFLEDLNLPAASYDVVTLFEVVEHLKEPLKLFQECHRILFPGGVMIVKTGNTDSWTAWVLRGKWEYFDMTRHGGHISFFNPFSMERLAHRCSFKIDRVLTRKVNLYEKNMLPYTLYRTSRLFANVLKHPAAWMGKGHEMLAYLQRLP